MLCLFATKCVNQNQQTHASMKCLRIKIEQLMIVQIFALLQLSVAIKGQVCILLFCCSLCLRTLSGYCVMLSTILCFPMLRFCSSIFVVMGKNPNMHTPWNGFKSHVWFNKFCINYSQFLRIFHLSTIKNKHYFKRICFYFQK